MTPLEALGIALVSGFAAAVATAWASVHVESLRHGYEDRTRFIDLRRKRYSDLLREADQHVRILKRQHDAVLDYVMENHREAVDAPTLESTDPLSHMAAEISLLGQKEEVGRAATSLYEALVGLDRFAWNAATSHPREWIDRVDKPMDEALAAYDAARTRFLDAAKKDLGTA